MSNKGQDVAVQPIIIVRRKRGEEESHHGGVWKIAYADFMTAMMAFFLVMWLINAADRKTIVQVAAYFNPMRLTDRTEATKGLQNQNETDSKIDEKQDGKKETKAKEDKETEQPKTSKSETGPNSVAANGATKDLAIEHAIFVDPMAALNVLASQAKSKRLARGAGENNKSPKAPRDPFDPASRLTETQSDLIDPMAEPAKPRKSVKQGIQDTPPATSAAEVSEAKRTEDAAALAQEIKASVAKVVDKLPNIQVKATPEGLLVSVTDDVDFGMFEIGSAKPKPEVVLVVANIAEALKSRSGAVVVRGHTDARPYTSGVYDNWRLSTARAQMAYYMLVRGGLSEDRFLAVEGRADREPSVASDPNAAQNRRIDILIKEPAL